MPLFGGPHRHGINYSTHTVRKTADCAKIPQEKKIARANITARHLPVPRHERRGERAIRERGGTAGTKRRNEAMTSATVSRGRAEHRTASKHAETRSGTHDEMRARRGTPRPATRETGRVSRAERAARRERAGRADETRRTCPTERDGETQGKTDKRTVKRGATRETGRRARRMSETDERSELGNGKQARRWRHMTQRADSQRNTSCGSQYVAEGHGDGLKRFNR